VKREAEEDWGRLKYRMRDRMDKSEYFLIVIDEDRKQFTVEGPLADDQPWNNAIASAKREGRRLRRCNIGSLSRADAIAEWQYDACREEKRVTWQLVEQHGCWWAYEGELPPPEAFPTHGRAARHILGPFPTRAMAEEQLPQLLSRRETRNHSDALSRRARWR
jgi:hypothetical protein